MSAAADYWEEMAEAEILATGGRGIYPGELQRKCCSCATMSTGFYCEKHRGRRTELAQLRATGATSGPRSSSGSKEGRGQL